MNEIYKLHMKERLLIFYRLIGKQKFRLKTLPLRFTYVGNGIIQFRAHFSFFSVLIIICHLIWLNCSANLSSFPLLFIIYYLICLKRIICLCVNSIDYTTQKNLYTLQYLNVPKMISHIYREETKRTNVQKKYTKMKELLQMIYHNNIMATDVYWFIGWRTSDHSAGFTSIIFYFHSFSCADLSFHWLC